MDINKIENSIKGMIDELKGLCQVNGLSNQAIEEEIISSVFLYKFLNDKFMYNVKTFAKEMNVDYLEVLNNKDDLMNLFYDSYPRDVALTYDETINHLIQFINQDDFYKIFDEALTRISQNEKNDKFSIQTVTGTKKSLFSSLVKDLDNAKKDTFIKNLFGIIANDKYDFQDAFNANFDFFSTIFEYLIKDYNVASGTYAEYFTPQSISKVIAKILVNMSEIDDKKYDIYDPSAGSGSLVLHLAHEIGKSKFGNRSNVYTQDISLKSSRFLRINMLLNGLSSSLHNIRIGDTIESPVHFEVENDASSDHKKFDFITSNPPFNVDFSLTRDSIVNKWAKTDRFFAGIPKIPDKQKDKMAIYLCFIQHILWSLKENGKAAIVVPSGFLTSSSAIQHVIIKKIVDENWLRGVITMPSNVFANTNTKVSIIFIEKNSKNNLGITMLNASNIGEKIKNPNDKNTRVVLSNADIDFIFKTFTNKKDLEGKCAIVNNKVIIENNYNISPSTYIKHEIEIKSHEEINNELKESFDQLIKLINETNVLEEELIPIIKDLKEKI